MDKVVKFNLEGYDPFIDFIKAYAIICVLIGHVLPNLNYIGYGLWAGMQVPLFILVQVFHSLKKDPVKIRISKLWWRILFPFFLIQATAYLLCSLFWREYLSLVVSEMVESGGFGPGSYFPWVYIQMALLLTVVSKYISRVAPAQLAIISIVICEGFEILSSIVNLSDEVHRLLAIRYFFLIYLGWIWVKEGIVINKKNIILSFLSLLSVIYFEYFSVDDEPLFYNTAWSFHRWPCYYYVAILGSYLLYLLYLKVKKSNAVFSFVKKLGKCSYEIFLIQMIFIPLFPPLYFIPDVLYLSFVIRISLLFVLSIFLGGLFHRFYNSMVIRYVQKR